MSYPVSLYDLIDIQTVKDYVEVTGSGDDNLIQLGITGFSIFMMRATGNTNTDGSLPTGNPLAKPIPCNDWYDGHGHSRLFLRSVPVQTVTVCNVGVRTISPSIAVNQTGYVIHQDRKSLVLRCDVFTRGTQNVNVQGTAGFATAPLDLVEMVMRVVGQNYKRRGWIDQASKSLSAQGATGTTSYRDWAMSKLDERVLLSFKRTAVV